MQGGIPTIIPQQILHLKQIFGVNTIIPKSISLLPSERIFYLAGYHAVIFNPKEKEKSQSYYPGAEGNAAITSVAVSNNRKTAALGFKALDKPCILYYELNASAKKKRMEFTEGFAFTCWTSIAFSSGVDTKHLASLTNRNPNGESLLVFWNPERARCEAYHKVHTKEDKDLIEVHFNPGLEASVVSVLGEHTLRIFQLKEDEKSFTVDESRDTDFTEIAEKYTLRCHLYLHNSSHIAILAEEATVIADYKGSIVQRLQINGSCLSNWTEGFFVGSAGLQFVRYEEQKYKIKNFVELVEKDTEVKAITCLEERLAILATNGSMLQGRVRFEPIHDAVRATLQLTNLHFHAGAIVSLDVCVRKPLIATAGKDKTIKIWNYEERTVETPKSETEAAISLSFHPSGFHLAVAYSDKLRILNLRKDGQSMSTFKDVNSFRNCTYVKFSHGGQYFAATSGNLVHIFRFYTGENPVGMTFSGHTGKIKCLAWSKEDNVLVTCGTDGVILAHRVRMQNCGERLLYSPSSKETRIKGVSYSSVAIGIDNTIYAMGIISTTGQRILKQLRLDGTENTRELAHNNCLQMAFPSTGKILFCGSDDRSSSGSVKCYKFPSTAHTEQFMAHDSQGVEKLCVSADDKYLVSAGRDGCVMMFEIKDKEARSDKIKEVLPVSSEVLITKNDLDTLRTEIDNLVQEKNELESMVSGGPVKDDQVKQLKDKSSSDQSQFLQKYNAIIEKRNIMRKKFDQELRTRKEQFENGLQQYDSNQAKNVMQQSAKYDELKRTQEDESRTFQKDILRHQAQNERDMKRLEQDYLQRIKSQKDRKVDVRRKIERLEREHKQTMKQIEEEKKEEIEKIRNENAQQVQNITEASLRAKSDVSITKKKISQKKQEMEGNMEQQRENKDEISRLEIANKDLQRQIEQQANVIKERDSTIDVNEKKIYDLKKKSQQLQKFKYVLDHKIKELKKDIAPREQEIARMKAQTNKMDKDLKNLNSLNTALAEFVAVLFKNEEALKAKIAGHRGRISFLTNKIKAFKDGLYAGSQVIQDEAELIRHVTQLKERFVSQSMTQVKMDSEIEQEYRNQKKYLQKSIGMLKKNLQKDSDIHTHENIRIMKDNVDLIKEISSLRLEIREENINKGTEDEKKPKNEPTEEALKTEIEDRLKSIRELQEKIKTLQVSEAEQG